MSFTVIWHQQAREVVDVSDHSSWGFCAISYTQGLSFAGVEVGTHPLQIGGMCARIQAPDMERNTMNIGVGGSARICRGGGEKKKLLESWREGAEDEACVGVGAASYL